MKQPAIYMLASRRNGTLYTGVTSDLVKRIWEHRNDIVEGFTKRYGVHSLVYFELHDDMSEAIRREKQIKKWNRAWKIELIERTNPQWQDLWRSLTEGEEMDSRMRGNASGCVVPAKAGTQELPARLDSRLRGNDRGGDA
jgi:putative endonuclease